LFDDPAGLDCAKAQDSLPQSARRPVSNYRGFVTFPQAQMTSLLAKVESRPPQSPA